MKWTSDRVIQCSNEIRDLFPFTDCVTTTPVRYHASNYALEYRDNLDFITIVTVRKDGSPIAVEMQGFYEFLLIKGGKWYPGGEKGQWMLAFLSANDGFSWEYNGMEYMLVNSTDWLNILVRPLGDR